MAMVALYLVIFWQARLYSEAGLQVFFFVVQGWGWYLWAKAGGLAWMVSVRWMGWRWRGLALVLVAASSLGIGWIMASFTDAALPYADATIAGASVVAQILLALRRVENWVLWIAVDLLAVFVYIERGLLLTAGLYVVFFGMATLGLIAWARAASEVKAVEA
jgi:nicotinamide mononucleotide transporter